MATATARAQRFPTWVMAALPALLIAGLIAAFVALDPIGRLREVPAVEAIAIERTTLDPGHIELRVRNDGPDPVTISQVLVDEAYWGFEAGDTELGRLESTTIDIDYPWDDGMPLSIGLVTSTGLVIDHEIDVAAETPEVDASTLGIYALLGLYIGVIPVAVGLLWFPALAKASRRWIGFFLAFTVGLLAFLLVDTVGEGLELAGETGGALDGLGLFAIGALAAVMGLLYLERSLAGARGRVDGLALAYLIAAGIGLHNLGEGLAVGAALAAGEIALGTFLILGFAIHNTTEGLAIVAPLGKEKTRPSIWHFVALGAVAGAPTILGAWMGGFAFAAAWAALAFGFAAGAIAQVVWTIARHMSGEEGLTSGVGVLGFLAGLLFMYGTGLFTA